MKTVISIKYILFLLTALIFISGCSNVTLIPDTVENGNIDTADNSITLVKNGLEIKAKAADISLTSYNLETNVTSFFLSIKNISKDEVSFNEDSFLLVDDKGIQYSLLTPEKVREMIKKDSYYLMPYPYVGFYYLEDFQKTSFYNKTSSALPYYYELYPQDIFSKALPFSAIIPQMKIEGLLYFKVEPYNLNSLKLYVYKKGNSKASNPDSIIPFKVKK